MSYTYLIGWPDHDKWYYGVRYAKGCHPDELWITYFTSSKHVKRFSAKHGAPSVIEVRSIFDAAEKAVLWEQKVLRRMNVEKDKRFLNAKNDTTKTIITQPNTGSFAKGFTPWNKGKCKPKRPPKPSVPPPAHAGTIWINNGTEHRRIAASDLDKYEGWQRGRLIPQDQIQQMIANRTTIHDPITGRFLRTGA